MWFKRKNRNRRIEPAHVLDVKLSSNQLRAARLRFAGIFLSSIFGVTFLCFAVWRGGEYFLNRFIYENDSFAIQTIEVTTDGVLSTDQIRKWAMVRRGENLLALDLIRVRRDLEMIPSIQSAALERIMPSTLKIRVTEREPVAQLYAVQRGQDGSLATAVFHLDEMGFVMPPLEERYRAKPPAVPLDELPVITGLNISQIRAGRLLDAPHVSAAIQFLLSFEQSSIARSVEVNRIDVSTPDILRVFTRQQSEILFSTTDFETQLRRWWLVHDQYQRWGKSLVTLDLSISNNLPVRWVDATGTPAPVQAKGQKFSRRKKHV